MAPRRLIAPTHVERWDVRLRTAADAALRDMEQQVRAALRSHGILPPASSLVAAGPRKKAAASGALGLVVWDATAWQGAIARHVQPAAAQVGTEASAAARASVPAAASWGWPGSAPVIAGTLVAGATAAGAYLGSRLNKNIQAAASPAQAASDIFDTAGDIVGGQLGAAAEAASNMASYDVASYVAGYFGDVYTDATKTWSAVGDEKTRPDHMDADGQQVGINDTFQVGGEALLYPGDPEGSDEQTMNCRCWTTTDGIDPGQAAYGEPEEQDASQGLENILNRAGSTSPSPTSPRSYPN
jgi:hypothetical protein